MSKPNPEAPGGGADSAPPPRVYALIPSGALGKSSPPGGPPEARPQAAAACQYGISGRFRVRSLEAPVCVTLFKRGAVLSWPKTADPPEPLGIPWQCGVVDFGHGGAVDSRPSRSPSWWRGRWPSDPVAQSWRSRRDLAFLLGNSAEWDAMATLTFASDVPPDDAFSALKRLRKVWTRAGVETWAWMREHSQRGRVHFHLFIAAPEVWDEPRIRRLRRSGPVDVVCGRIGQAIERAWIRESSRLTPLKAEAIRRFHERNTVELLRTPDAAGRYAAKEAGKAAQKTAGPEWAGRRWWGRSESVEALPIGTARLAEWPEGVPPITRLWDRADLEGLLAET